MKHRLPRGLRWALPVTTILVSCLHTVAPKVAPEATLHLSEAAPGLAGRAPLAVVAAGPRGVISAGEKPAITLVFNRSMRGVTEMPNAHLPRLTVTTADGHPVSGQSHWVGTHGLIFQPAAELPGSTRFHVTVPRNTPSVDGAQLPADYMLEFSTQTARVLTVVPSPGTNRLRPTDPIYLKFSQPVDPAELQKQLQLVEVQASKKQGRELPVQISVGTPRWNETTLAESEDLKQTLAKAAKDDPRLWLQLTPTQPLPSDAHLQLNVGKGLRAVQGPLLTEDRMQFSLRTLGPLRLEDVLCARQNVGRCEAHRDISVTTSTPVLPAEFRKYLRVKGPKRPAQARNNVAASRVRAGTKHPLSIDPEFGDKFTITLQAGMTDVFGQKLQKPVSVDIAIEEPFSKPPGPSQAQPEESEDTETTTEVAEAAPKEPPASVPHRPQLAYDLAIGIRGSILEALAGPNGSQGKTNFKIPVSAVNVPTYGITAGSMSEWAVVRDLNVAPGEELQDQTWDWFTPGAAKNTRAVRQLDVTALLDGKHSGALRVALAGLGQLGSPSQSIINVTDLGISARVSRFGTLAWLTRLSTGQPVADATATVYGANGDIVCAGQTDPQGMIRFSPQQLKPIARNGLIDSQLLLVARAGDDFTYQRLQPSDTINNDGRVDYAQRGQWVGLVFTDRGVYRPGETVKVGGYFRHTAEKGFTVLANAEYRYVVNDAQGETIASGRGKLDAFGALSADVLLTKSAALGHTNFNLSLGQVVGESFTAGFEILSYKPAEFKVAVDSKQREAVHGQSATFDISSEYLFGSPVAGARVQQYVTRTEASFTPRGTQGFVTDDSVFRQDLRYAPERGSAYFEAKGELDANGKLSRTVPLNAPEQWRPEQLTFEAEVQDLSQQTQANRSQVIVHPAKFYLGLKQPTRRFLAIGAKFPVQAVAVTPDGARLPNIPITLELWKRTWSSVVEDEAADKLHYRTNVHDKKVAGCNVVSGAQPAACPLALTEPGYYILRGLATDDLGNPARSSVSIYAVDDRADSVAVAPWQPADRKSLDLELDQKVYQPGDTARVLIKSPFKHATALVTVERSGVLDQTVKEINGSMPIVEVPVKPEYFPNAYVSVHLVRGRVAAMPEAGLADVGAPDYRVGYTPLRVDPESHRLKVQIATPRTQYHPGDNIDANVQLTTLDGQPSAGTVTFYVVDEGVLLLTGYRTPDPLPAFSEPRALGVFAVESREHLARFIKWRNGERVPILGYEVAEGSYSDKGNEVGGGLDLPGKIRSDFRTTVYFEAGRSVGANGQTKFNFKLPDNLTSFRLMAVAAGQGDRFGFTEHTITSNRPLMARPMLPRQLRVGDQTEAGVIVTTKGIGPTTVDVSLAAHGVTTLGPTRQRVNVPANGQAEVRFPVKATTAGKAGFDFAAVSAGNSDRVQVTRQVQQPLRWVSAAAIGATHDTAAVALGDISGTRRDQGELTVTVSSSALVGLKSVFDELSDYPYGCTEQLASRLLPWVSAPKLAEQQQVRMPATLHSDIDGWISEISKRQRWDGSFGYWEDDPSKHPWLAAYALLSLERASSAGYFVAARVREQAVRYLTTQLDAYASREAFGTGGHQESSDDTETNESSANEEDELSGQPAEKLRQQLAQAAFIADTLARIGQLDQSRLHRLLAEKTQQSLSARIQLLSAAARLRLPRQQLDTMLASILKEVTVGAAEARVETSDPALAEILDSPTRSTALLLQAVLIIDPKNPLATKLARGLVHLRRASGYRNTQEDAWALMALEDYRNIEEPEPPQFGARVFMGDSLVDSFAFNDLPVHSATSVIKAADLLSHPEQQVSLSVTGQGTAHYSMLLRMAKDTGSSPALDEGFSIEKHFRATEPKQLKEIAKLIPDHSEPRAALGQLVLVDLLLETALPRNQIVLDDPLPSGLEAVEFGFATSAQSLATVEQEPSTKPHNAPDNALSYGQIALRGKVHREIRDDHVVHFVEYLAPGIHHFRYLARATTPGTFVVPPTRAACMYETEVFGQTAGAAFEVQPKR